jgi:hypothetical protein
MALIDEPVSALGRDELETADYVSHALRRG